MAFRSALCPNVRLLHNVITEAEEAIVDKFLTSLFSRKRYQGEVNVVQLKADSRNCPN